MRLTADPAWYGVLAGLPDGRWVDPLVAAEPDPAGGGTGVRLRYRSGATVPARLSAPAPGAVRLTVGRGDLDLPPGPPVAVEAAGGTEVRVLLDGAVVAALGPGGLRTAAVRRPGAARFEVDDKDALPIADLATGTGRLMAGEVQVGWVESVALGTTDAVHGGGESFQSLDLRGRRRTLLNRETHTATGRDMAYVNVPLLWSPAGWAVWVNTGGMVGADVGASQQETLSLVVDGTDLDLVLFGGAPAQVQATMWALTGTPGEVPDWAFGIWMSRATYVTEDEIHAVLDELDAAGAMPDVVHVDAWLAGNVFRTFTCEWRGDRVRFPAGWTHRLRERGVRSSVWLNPFVLAGSEVGEQLRRDGLLMTWPDGSPATTSDRDNRWVVDFTNPAACRWWREQVAQLFAVEAPDAVKLDFAEEVPFDGRCHDGRSGAQLRNAYARMYQAQTAQALRELGLAGQVPMFCRAGTHGAQRNPCHWVGDTPATWDGLAAALYAVQSLSLSGFGLVSHDAGGFISPGTGDIPTARLDGLDVPFFADVDPELYARWVQWGAVSPVMRLHGLGLREPTAYPEPYREAAIAAFAVRRRLAPLLPGAYRDGLAQGLPLLRPMALAVPGDRAAAAAQHQYFLGPDVLVAPVLGPGEHQWWMPAGDWVNLFDGSALAVPAAGWHEGAFPIGSFPAWARAGSPFAP